LIEGESGGFEMGEMPVLSCPKCNAQRGFPIDEEPQTSCEHCDSIELKAVTPIAVIKSELGRKLTSKEKRIVEEWEAEND
jgi:hypothetical protein